MSGSHASFPSPLPHCPWVLLLQLWFQQVFVLHFAAWRCSTSANLFIWQIPNQEAFKHSMTFQYWIILNPCQIKRASSPAAESPAARHAAAARHPPLYLLALPEPSSSPFSAWFFWVCRSALLLLRWTALKPSFWRYSSVFHSASLSFCPPTQGS